MSHRTTTRRLLKLSAALAVIACATAIVTAQAVAEEVALKIKRTVKLDAVGNAEIRLQVTAPTNLYTAIKSEDAERCRPASEVGCGP